MDRSVVAYDPADRDALLELALRSWAPVFEQLRSHVPGFVYDAFYPDGWRARQRADLGAVLDGEPESVDVAMADDGPAGWVCTRLHPEDRMAEVYVIAVDPAHQRSGVARMLLRRAHERARAAGARMIMVETGDDPGHAAARALYEADGYVRWPVARYFREL